MLVWRRPTSFLARVRDSPRYSKVSPAKVSPNIFPSPAQASNVCATPLPLWGWGGSSSSRLQRSTSVNISAADSEVGSRKPASSAAEAVQVPPRFSTSSCSNAKDLVATPARNWHAIFNKSYRDTAPTPVAQVRVQASVLGRPIWDNHVGTACRYLPNGGVEHATAKEGSDGFVECVFADGFIFHSEIPNSSVFRVATPKAKAKAQAKAKTKAKAKAKAKAKTKAKAKAKAKACPSPKAKAQVKAKAAPKAKAVAAPKASSSKAKGACDLDIVYPNPKLVNARKGNVRCYMVGKNPSNGKPKLLTELTQKHTPIYDVIMQRCLKHAIEFNFTKRQCIQWRDDHWQD